MLKALIRKQLRELLLVFTGSGKKGKTAGKGALIGYILLALFVLGALGFAFFMMGIGLGPILLGHGSDWLYFTLTGLLAIALGVFGSAFSTYSSLYLPKDNEFLMSLPIPPRTLLLARATGVYITSFLYGGLIWIPSMIAYWVQAAPGPCAILFQILLMLLIPLFVSVLSCALGWVIALIAARVKGKAWLTSLLGVLAFAAYYTIYFRISGNLGDIAQYVGSIGNSVGKKLRYMHLLGCAAEGDPLSMLLYVLITFALAAVCLYVLSATFGRLAHAEAKTPQRANGAESFAGRSAAKALLAREFRHFTSTSVWMLNGGLGLLIMPALAVILLVKAGEARDTLTGLTLVIPNVIRALPVFLAAATGLVISMDMISPASVSMEGRSLWIIQSLPADPRDILRAKERMSYLLNIPAAALAVILCGIALRFSVWSILCAICAVASYSFLVAAFGLMMNLLKPNLNWTTPTVAVKQGMAVMVSMFGGWLYCILSGAGGWFLSRAAGPEAALAAMTMLNAALWYAVRKWLNGRGCEIIEYMQA